MGRRQGSAAPARHLVARLEVGCECHDDEEAQQHSDAEEADEQNPHEAGPPSRVPQVGDDLAAAAPQEEHHRTQQRSAAVRAIEVGAAEGADAASEEDVSDEREGRQNRRSDAREVGKVRGDALRRGGEDGEAARRSEVGDEPKAQADDQGRDDDVERDPRVSGPACLLQRGVQEAPRGRGVVARRRSKRVRRHEVPEAGDEVRVIAGKGRICESRYKGQRVDQRPHA